MGDAFTEAMFAENLNTKFRVQGLPREIELELIELTSLSSTPNQVQFSIWFQGPADVYLPQQIYGLDHERLGRLDLFLVPVGKNEDGFQYEAVFNRMVE